MTPQTSFLEVVPSVALLSQTTPRYLALLVLERPEEALLQALSALYPQSDYLIGVVEPALAYDPIQVIKQAKALGIPSIFIQSKTPSLDQIDPNLPFSASLVSPGTTPIADQLIQHPSIQHFSWIGYQTYQTPPPLLLQLQSRYFSSLRLGAYRENPKAAEPLIRPNTYHFVDVSAVRYSDASDAAGSGPNGLYAEEICQLMRYIGVSSQLDACFIYHYPQKTKPLQIITQLLAQILWHLFESLATHQNEDPYQSKGNSLFSEKEVHIGGPHQAVRFLCSVHTKRWWFNILDKNGNPNYIPCTHEEYLTALKGELPLNWLHHYQKLNAL